MNFVQKRGEKQKSLNYMWRKCWTGGKANGLLNPILCYFYSMAAALQCPCTENVDVLNLPCSVTYFTLGWMRGPIIHILFVG